ncbi:phage tail-collar fiber domain-containing protein [Acinetobacter lwoffii]|uniref:phage tail-collar fiber domain-containing protein n=1 Tax=Acinetobacter lwoffii TaxID=28090 RepID=UPI00209B2E94|nr:phage tail protein [Acinetobacter lwoffii]MCO8062353.1 phage tail protein [Acinetobacter lwoffii]
MASQFHSLFTTQGLALLREAIQTGAKLGITHMAYGDGNGMVPTPNADFTKLVKEVYRAPLNRLAPSKDNQNWLEADGVIPSAVGGFNIREVGLYAGNILVAYANYPSTYKPSADQGTAQIKTIRIVLQIDNTANFELKIDASVVMATIQAVEDIRKDIIDYTDLSKIGHVESIDELLEYPRVDGKTVLVKSYIAGKNRGGGHFVYHQSKSDENDGGTIINGWVRITVEQWRNIQWWGAQGDGTTDDTQAFIKAVKAHSKNKVPGSTAEGSFCTLFLPASDGNYVVSDTIYMLPYMRIKGDSSKGGSLEWINNKFRSCIEARFPENINYKFVLSTTNFMKSSGELCPWSLMPSGSQYDSGQVTGCFGTSVEDLVIVNNDVTKRVYGAIKMQNAPQCSVEKCFIRGFDVAVASCGSWDSRFDFGSETFKCGFIGYGDMNNTYIRGYHHGKKGSTVLPLPLQVDPLSAHDTTSGLSFDESTKRYGVYLHFAYGFTIDSLINEYHDVGLLITQSKGVVKSLYNEGNTISVAGINSSFRIGSLMGVGNDYVFDLGSFADIHLDTISPDHAKIDFIKSASIYSSKLHLNKSINAPYNKAIQVDRSVIYINATDGDDKNSGLNEKTAVKTLDQAIICLSNLNENTFTHFDATTVKQSKTLIICDSSNYSLKTWAYLNDLDLTIKKLQKSLKPKITVSNYNFILENSKVQLSDISLNRTYDNTWLASQGFFICDGDCTITTKDSTIDLAFPLVTVNPDKSARVKLNILGGTGEMTTEAKYVATTSKNTAFDVFIRLANTGVDLNNSTDQGIAVPVQSFVQKSISSNI